MLIRLGFMSSSFMSFEKNHTVVTFSLISLDGLKEFQKIRGIDKVLSTQTAFQWV